MVFGRLRDLRNISADTLRGAALLLLYLGLLSVITSNLLGLLAGIHTPLFVSASLLVLAPAAFLSSLVLPYLGMGPPLAYYRLRYTTPPDWDDGKARRALYALADRAGRVSVVWERGYEGLRCYVGVPPAYAGILGRMAPDVWPGGVLQPVEPPAPSGDGFILPLSQKSEPPTLLEMPPTGALAYYVCGVGVVTVSGWGVRTPKGAEGVQLRGNLSLQRLLRPPVKGRPDVEMSLFPSSAALPEIASQSSISIPVPPGYVLSNPALTLGAGEGGVEVGLSLGAGQKGSFFEHIAVLGGAHADAGLGTKHWQVYDLLEGIAATGMGVVLLDGAGDITPVLAQGPLRRDVSEGRAQVIDLERPGQGVRVNPLWLPPQSELWPAFLGRWVAWMQDLGVTAAALGRDNYLLTLAVVGKTALAAAASGMALDPPTLRGTLADPSFLRVGDVPLPGNGVLGEAEHWWQEEGRKLSRFRLKAGVSVFRQRIGGLLDDVVYRVLWSEPYLDLPVILDGGGALLCRLGTPRLSPYGSGLLLALMGVLARRRALGCERPLALVASDLPVGSRLGSLLGLAGESNTAVALISRQGDTYPEALDGTVGTVVVRRVEDEAAAGGLLPILDGVTLPDLLTLPDGRAVIKMDEGVCTVQLQRPQAECLWPPVEREKEDL